MAKTQEVKLTQKDFEKDPERGKHPNQKLKAYLVLQHLLKETDENHLLVTFLIFFVIRVLVYSSL